MSNIKIELKDGIYTITKERGWFTGTVLKLKPKVYKVKWHVDREYTYHKNVPVLSWKNGEVVGATHWITRAIVNKKRKSELSW